MEDRRLQLHTVFQPIVHLHTNEVIGFEALLRSSVAPVQLFKQAEKKGVLSRLDQYARYLALQSYQRPEKLFINCHPLALEQGISIDVHRYSHITPEQIVLEITEQNFFNIGKVRAQVHEFRELGMKLALDDFGHGFTNLSLIEFLEPDYLKLDKIMLRNIHNNKGYQLLNGIRKLAEEVGITIIAEGIETRQQRDIVRSCGIGLGQGWYYGQPAALPALT
ncbi:cyclic diguanylate phosphodiesterase domain protein [Aneurinibacillus aneurinilyticus ATCC 12856]|uniref:Cyclic diguanylate phosphodiesterase domain protein n=1 Tax=Aneurinibacillus aneurinilyticus ATCC 12856 TaxID=649747 RepID=U1WYH1_ANEAE|nr:cyclic diguanylate phosphodiesterase domain protein [Aneurinibacillus aneurinilyticus ATCC 12856]